MPNDLELTVSVLVEKVLNLEVQVRSLEGLLVAKGLTTPAEIVDANNTVGLEDFEKVEDRFKKDFENYKNRLG